MERETSSKKWKARKPRMKGTITMDDDKVVENLERKMCTTDKNIGSGFVFNPPSQGALHF